MDAPELASWVVEVVAGRVACSEDDLTVRLGPALLHRRAAADWRIGLHSMRPAFWDAGIEDTEVAHPYLARVVVRTAHQRHRLEVRASSGQMTVLTFSPALPDIRWEDHLLPVRDGEMRVRRYPGSGARTGIVLHRGHQDVSQWDFMAAALGAELVALDLRNHGLWTGNGAFDFATIAEDIATAAAYFEAVDPVVIGHSLGGFAGLTAAVRLGWRDVVTLDGPVSVAAPVSAKAPGAAAAVTADPELGAAVQALARFDLSGIVARSMPGWRAALCRDSTVATPEGRSDLAAFVEARGGTATWLDASHTSLVAAPGAARDLLAAVMR